MKINRHVCSNGLRLLHYEEPNTQVSTVNLMYDVGSKDEHPDHTGFAHLFEHLMFSGSENAPDFDSIVQDASGENNAWTSPDVTNYFITLPTHNMETALFLESDRMMALNINQRSLDVQKQVVLEEFKQRYLNQPYGDASLILRPLAYNDHPYSWPTIGKSVEHIGQFELNDVRSFYERYYAPNNAVLAICGNLPFEKAVDLVEKWFGDIPSRKCPARNIRQVRHPWNHRGENGLSAAHRSVSVNRDVPVDALYKQWFAPSATEDGYVICDLLTDVLDGGRSSRFNRHLIKGRHIFNSLDIYVGGEGEVSAGSIQFCGKPAQGVSLEEAEEALQQELERLWQESVAQDELRKVKNKYESAFLFKNTNCQHIASQLCWYEILGTAENYLRDYEIMDAVTASDLQSMAHDIFQDDNSVTLYYRAG